MARAGKFVSIGGWPIPKGVPVFLEFILLASINLLQWHLLFGFT
jgi:hypothetical protein